MPDDLRSRADARLEQALEGAPVRDPRPYFRAVLKHLKERDPRAFERALRHYEDVLVPAVAEEGDPLAEWLEYGRLLASLTGPGRTMAVDGTGLAVAEELGDAGTGGEAGRGSGRGGTRRSAGSDATADPPPPALPLLLHLPDEPAAPALVLRCPADATPAQDATLELLVLGRVSVSDRLSAISEQWPSARAGRRGPTPGS